MKNPDGKDIKHGVILKVVATKYAVLTNTW